MIIKFLMSGGTAALVEYATFLLLHGAGLKLLLANALSFSGGLVTSFMLNKHWVFSHKGDGRKQFVLYFVLAAVNLAIGSGLLLFLVHGLKIPAFISKICVMGMIATWNYLVYKKIIFKESQPIA